MKKDSSELVLLDVNALVALAWPNHQFHLAATRRLGRSGQRWATCAITQLGFIRLSSNPAVIPNAVRPAEAVSLLAQMIADPLHEYLPTTPAPVEVDKQFSRILGYRQVADVYLIAVAAEHDALLLTFDARLRDLGNVEVLL